MNSSGPIRALYVFAVALGTLLYALRPSAAQRAKPHHTEYCTIANHPMRYDHQVLTTEGIYRRGGEISSFYNAACSREEDASWVEYSSDLQKVTSPQLMAEMDRILRAGGRVGLVAVVRFDGPKAVDVPPGTSPGLAALMRGTNARYGHSNEYRYQITLLRIIAVRPIAAGTPWPH